jgi:hypothetical protein
LHASIKCTALATSATHLTWHCIYSNIIMLSKRGDRVRQHPLSCVHCRHCHARLTCLLSLIQVLHALACSAYLVQSRLHVTRLPCAALRASLSAAAAATASCILQYYSPVVVPPGTSPTPGGNLSTLDITQLGEWDCTVMLCVEVMKGRGLFTLLRFRTVLITLSLSSEQTRS